MELSVGGQQFHGKGRTRQAAKHDAAAKAIKYLQKEPILQQMAEVRVYITNTINRIFNYGKTRILFRAKFCSTQPVDLSSVCLHLIVFRKMQPSQWSEWRFAMFHIDARGPSGGKPQQIGDQPSVWDCSETQHVCGFRGTTLTQDATCERAWEIREPFWVCNYIFRDYF